MLIDFVKDTNDRSEKILDFRHPEDMIKLLDLKVPEEGVTLQQLIHDCATTLKYQVKTGKIILFFIFKYIDVPGRTPKNQNSFRQKKTF